MQDVHTDATRNILQCWDLLANNVASVFTTFETLLMADLLNLQMAKCNAEGRVLIFLI